MRNAFPPPFALALLLSAGLLTSCAPGGPARTAQAGEAPVAIRTAAVEAIAWAPPVRVAGRLRRLDETALAFKVGGVVEAVSVRAGDSVTAGQVLATLKPDEIAASVAQARAEYEKAVRDLARAEDLAAKEVIPAEALQNVQTYLDITAAALRAAEFNQRYARILAPGDGVILRRLAEPETLLSPGQPVLQFAPIASGWVVEIQLSGPDSLLLRPGDRAEVTLSGLSGPPFAGTLVRLAGAADPATQTIPGEISLAGLPPGISSGMVAHVRLVPAPREPRPSVPAAALLEGDGHTASLYLFDAASSTVQRQEVEVLAFDSGRAILREGLAPGQRVVVAGAEFLASGSVVTAMP